MIIKKLNSLFHKHARVLFGIFAVIIIIAFMDFLTPGRGGCVDTDQGNAEVGSAFGKTVKVKDLRELSNKFYILGALQNNRVELDIQDLFWVYCRVRRAEQLGINISEKMVADVVKKLPAFQKNGKFDIALYDEFLKSKRISDSDVADAIRLSMLMDINYIRGLLAGNIEVTDGEIESFYRANNARFAVAVKVFSHDAFKKDVKAPADDVLKAMLKASPEKYIYPENIEAVVAEAAVAADADGAKKALAKLGAFRKAFNEAVAKEKNTAKYAGIFSSLAKANGLEVKNTGKAQSGDISGKFSAELVYFLKNIPANAKVAITPIAATAGNKNFAIALRTAYSAEKAKTFSEAKAELVKDYYASETRKLASVKAAEAVAAIKKLDKKAWYDEFKKLGNLLSFAPDHKPKDVKEASLLGTVAPALTALGSGDISPAIDGSNSTMIVYIIKRVPANMAELSSMRDYLRWQLFSAKAEAAFGEYIESIMKNCSCKVGSENSAQ